MTAEKQHRRTFLLDDIPAPEDAFASDGAPGPHQRVADAIVELITSPDEHGGKMIGLEGGWGSGKSTVVRFMRDRLAENDHYTVIPFDAWAHEGDPLRRTYLETVIRHLQECQWIAQKPWDKKKKEIANRRRVTRTKTIPKTTKLGTWLSLSVFCLPAGAAFLASGLDDGITFDTNAGPAWTFIVGALLSFAPLLVLLIHAACLVFKRPISWKRVLESDRWCFLEGKATSETKTETVETPNPTSIEFEGYFTDAMKEALGADGKRRLLLVLDNLDRVDPEDAIGIWSTLQTFLQEGVHRDDTWFKQLWVLVPYDPSGLRKLWDNREADKQRGAQDQANEDRSANDASAEEDRHASGSFLDKSFQIRFRVPPPVLSDWKPYLDKLVKKALPDHDEGDRHTLYRVFEHCRPNAGEPPTPRELKLYVNQIGAIHRQWQDEFPIGHVAYYVLQCRNHQSIVQKLRSGNFPDSSAQRLLGEDLQRNLAGLAFNAPADKGIELLLADPIYQNLANGRHEELMGLETRHAAGFWAVLDIVVSTKIQEAEPLVIAQAGQCLSQPALFSDTEALEAETVRRDIRKAAEAVAQWKPLDETMAVGISALCRIQNDLSFSRKIGGAVAATLADAKVQEDSPTMVAAMLIVLRCLSDLDHTDAIPKQITLPVDAAGWITTCQGLAERYWKHVRPKVEFAEISKALVTAINGGEFGQEHIDAVLVSDACPVKSSWNEVVTAVTTRLNAGKATETSEVRLLFEGLWELRHLESEEAKNSLNTLVTGGHVMHHLHQTVAQEDQECQAICIATSLREAPTAAVPPVVGDSAAGHTRLTKMLASSNKEIAKKIVLLLRKHDELGVLFEIADAKKQYDPLISTCLRVVAEDTSPQELFSCDVVLERWQAIQGALNTEDDDSCFGSLLAKLATEHNLCQGIQEAEKGFSPEDAELYWTIVAQADGAIDTFLKWCKDGLRRMDATAWGADLQGTCDCVRLACSLADKGATPKLTTHLGDALVADHARSLAAGKHVPEEAVLKRWQDLLGYLDENVRNTLRPHLLLVAVDVGGDIQEAFFQMYGDEIADSEILSGNDKTVPNLFAALVEKNNMSGLRWLKGFFESNKAFLGSVSSKIDVSAFETRLRDRLISGGDGEAQRLVEEIAEILGVERPEDESEADDSEGDKSEPAEE